MGGDLTEHPDRAAMAQAAADSVAEDLRRTLSSAGRARLALPGGEDAAAFLTALGRAPLDWGRVAVTLSDEVWASPRSARSHQRRLGETLFAGAAAAAAFAPLTGDGPTPEDGIDALVAALEQTALPLDIAVATIDAEGGVAGLVPGADRLAEALSADAPAALTLRAPGWDVPRVALSARVLAGAAKVHLLLFGPAQAQAHAVAREEGPAEAAPLRAIVRGRADVAAHYAA